jgi:hypothetical protein
MKSIRPIAIYLPQFHPVRENDEWWGKGFTEWRNVAKAKPRFKGHYQPQLPSDLGYYDLRLGETREAQAALAKAYGVHGFCYYHYWFNGRRILERPFQEVFESGTPDFPFMLCWANENWTRVWDGGENAVLLKQEYSSEDDAKHARALIPYFKDPRYIKVDGKPVFAVYKDSLFPDIASTIRIFREECRKEGIELYFCRFERDRGTLGGPPEKYGFDAGIEFQPLSRSRKEYVKKTRTLGVKKYFTLWKYRDYFYRKIYNKDPERDHVLDYTDFVEYDITRPNVAHKVFPGASPGWDNSSRRVGRKAIIYINNTPAAFKKWIFNKVKRFTPYSPDENFLFINAWNEWAEGNHLEPDEKWGHQFLEALRDGIKEGLNK